MRQQDLVAVLALLVLCQTATATFYGRSAGGAKGHAHGATAAGQNIAGNQAKSGRKSLANAHDAASNLEFADAAAKNRLKSLNRRRALAEKALAERDRLQRDKQFAKDMASVENSGLTRKKRVKIFKKDVLDEERRWRNAALTKRERGRDKTRASHDKAEQKKDLDEAKASLAREKASVAKRKLNRVKTAGARQSNGKYDRLGNSKVGSIKGGHHRHGRASNYLI